MATKRRRILNSIINTIAVLVALRVGWNFYQQYRLGQELEGVDVSSLLLKPLDQSEAVGVASMPHPKVVIFWATWCGPCTMELARVNTLVKDGDIPRDRILAVSLGEDPGVVATAVEERGYRFPVFLDEVGQTQSLIPIEATPTVVYLDKNNIITDVDAGVNPFLTFKLRRFL